MVRKQVGHSSAARIVLLAIVLFTSRLAIAEDKTGINASVASSVKPIAAEGHSVVAPSGVLPEASVQAGGRVSSEVTRVPVTVTATNTTSTPQAPQSGLQDQIEEEARRLQLGVRGGVALDPELILVGAQIQLGPIFNSNVFFRPSVEFAYGEFTAMVGFNGEFLYRLSRSSPQDRWSTYFGGGLGINLLQESFEQETGERKIDFDDFHSDSALNILGGVQNRNGIFMELRTSVYSAPSPTLRLSVGYTF